MAQKRNILKTPIEEEKPAQKEIELEVKPRKEKEKGNRVKKADDEEKVSEKKSKREQEPTEKRNYFAFVKDERFKKIAGIFLMLCSFYFVVAFTSHLFTWQADQDKADSYGFFGLVFSSKEITVDNWLGKLGAAVSHLFVFRGFGLASYVFVLLSFVFGFKILTGVSLLPIRRLVRVSMLLLVLTSVTLSFVFSQTNYMFVGGAFGYHVNEWLIAAVGKVGTLLLIGFALLATFIFYFNPSFKKAVVNGEQETEEEVDENGVRINKIKIASTVNEGFASEAHEEEAEEYKKYVLKRDESDLNYDELELKIKDPDFTPEDEIVLEKIEPDQEEEPLVEKKQELVSEDLPENEITLSNDAGKPVLESADIDTSFQVQVNNADNVLLSDEEINAKLEEFGEFDPTLDLSDFKLPSINELENYGSGKVEIDKAELETNKNNIVNTLKNYDIEISQIKATVGPTVTLYEIVPAPGVRISKIKNLEDDIALSLSALGIRIIAPIPGKGTVGIEVPNSKPDIVSMRSLIASDKFLNSDMELPVALGKTIQNEVFIADLAKMPHLLMAGATGQGKSVGLNAILVSILYKKHPSQVKFVLVDPKKVELTLFNKIERHYLAKLPDTDEAIITNNQKVIHTLNSLCIEMDTRYELLKDAAVRNIKEYNAKFISRRLNPNNGHHFLPYIVLVVDEFADLIMTAGKEVETPIARLAQLARAIGIHLIIATQRPSVNVITGTIKANFPSRVAFRVTSKIDSRTILDAGGAEQLIGRGDMIYSTGSDIIRLQCGFVDTAEVDRITEFIGNQRGYASAYLLPEFVPEDGGGSSKEDVNLDDQDELFEEAARILVTHQQGSASLLQRKLKLGYNRAGRLVDQLEAAGIVGPFKGAKSREVLITDLSSLETMLNNRKNPQQ
ncbi:MAG TPA: DNA translocase FtsK 4TM domain-containing protein [Flavobacteriales bacterium]|nr:DNA translocase FtsK 4TM domain-containing protein [Flavobacteriales bacterium]